MRQQQRASSAACPRRGKETEEGDAHQQQQQRGRIERMARLRPVDCEPATTGGGERPPYQPPAAGAPSLGSPSSSAFASSSSASLRGGGHGGAGASPLRVMDLLRQGGLRGITLRELVESTLRELLTSDKTERCIELERRRNTTKEIAIFSRLLREAAHNRECLRPNALLLVGQVAFLCRKNRRVVSLRACGEAVTERVIEECTDAIAGLLLKHGGPRVARQIQNGARHREFITSMLFLMRAGISFQGRQILPRLEVLHQLLPLQVLLPLVFKIRAKSITEGESSIRSMYRCCSG